RFPARCQGPRLRTHHVERRRADTPDAELRPSGLLDSAPWHRFRAYLATERLEQSPGQVLHLRVSEPLCHRLLRNELPSLHYVHLRPPSGTRIAPLQQRSQFSTHLASRHPAAKRQNKSRLPEGSLAPVPPWSGTGPVDL
ncbi:unnamed protein product, partial [Ixodes persulcatus]